MRYFNLFYYTSDKQSGEEYEMKEMLIDEPTFRQIQSSIVKGGGLIVLENKVFPTSAIKEITPADDIVREHLATGISLKQLGLKELPKLAEGEKMEGLGEGMKRIDEMKSKSGFGQKMVDDEAYTSIQEETSAKERRSGK